MMSDDGQDVDDVPYARDPILVDAERPDFARAESNGRLNGHAAHPTRRARNLGDALITLSRVFDNIETLQLQCSVLEAEKAQSQISAERTLQGAFARIEDLETVVAGLMRIVAKYDNLLNQSNGRRREAEQRAAHAEIRVKETERGATEAVEWLYRYMSDSLHVER